ncbi:MAG: Gfo/Idh/MocA family oxidoreductase, partial [Clostridiales bacterium]|nr:Gfo/Idh/MocA family oxidoreductase [Clostridiales bacterium]
MSKLKFGIIGCGRISARHVDAILNNKDKAELVAVFDIVEELAIDRKNQYESSIRGSKVKVYTNYDEFLNDENMDVVTIASISGYHAKQALDCLNHNKHVLIEKPIALCIEDADKIIKLGKEKNKKICVSHQNRFCPAIQRLRRAVDEGRFGKLIHGSA